MEVETGERIWGQVVELPKDYRRLMAGLGPYFPYSGILCLASPDRFRRHR